MHERDRHTDGQTDTARRLKARLERRNSTRRRVELRRYRHPHRRNSTVADDRQCNWPSWTAYSQLARSRSVVFLFLFFLHGPWRLWSICHINRHVFIHNSINFSSNSSLQTSISWQTRQNTSYMTSRLTNWVNWVTTFRTDRWQLFTLWTCRRRVELSCVAINGL